MTAGLASLKGFEPPAYRLGGGRSIQLSYRDNSIRYSIPNLSTKCKGTVVYEFIITILISQDIEKCGETSYDNAIIIYMIFTGLFNKGGW